MIHGCCYVHSSAATIREASKKVGYAESEVFSAHVRKHLGIRPSNLRKLVNSDELFLGLIECLYKPAALERDPGPGQIKKRSTEPL